jgi:hypothetical protein
VIVTGEEDAPIVGAHVVLAEVGDKTGSQITDDVGQAFWYDLPGETVSISIAAQGYFPLDITDSIERGINQITVALERDPHGILPSEACAPGEKLLYIEDFQDGEAQGWQEIEYRVGGFDLGPHPDSQGNWVLLNDGDQYVSTDLQGREFDSAVWRIQFMTDGKREYYFRWRNKNDYEGGEVQFSDINAIFQPDRIIIQRRIWPISSINLLISKLYLTIGTWHQLEMSNFEGRLEVWLDGRRMLVYQDPVPLPSGTISLDFNDSPGVESVTYFDNISVCELSAPYVPMPTPES